MNSIDLKGGRMYRTDIGSLLFIGLNLLLFIAATLFLLFVEEKASFALKTSSVVLTTLIAFSFFVACKYKIVVYDEYLLAKNPKLAFLSKYDILKFDEIKDISNFIGLYPEMQNITLTPYDPAKKRIWIMVGLGLPWEALVDIMDRLPSSVQISFEPWLEKKIEKERAKTHSRNKPKFQGHSKYKANKGSVPEN